MADLWGEEIKVSPARHKEIVSPAVREHDLSVMAAGDTIVVSSRLDLSSHPDYVNFLGASHETTPDWVHRFSIPLRPVNCFTLRHLLKRLRVDITPQDARRLGAEADKLPLPSVSMSESGKTADVIIPPVHVYKELLKSVNGYPLKDGTYRVNVSRIMDLVTLGERMRTRLPRISVGDDIRAFLSDPIPGFDGTVDSLKVIPVDVLHVLQANSQSYKAVKASKKTLTEKFRDFGIETLYDLLLWLPRRYIDKSNPQDLSGLIEDESATIVGVIESAVSLPNNMGVSFSVRCGDRKIPVAFWRQHWLAKRFTPGTEVLITGKFGFYRGRPQLTGTSIESAQEASVLPIVPVYRQSESKGITTAVILSAVRELFSRMPGLELPEYLAGPNRVSYYDAFAGLHLPTDLKRHEEVVASMAYYELVAMQILIQEQREQSRERTGIPQPATSRGLQELAIRTLPFELTGAQRRGIEAINAGLANVRPSSYLLNADVGSGKTLVAQLACLRSAEAGYQAALMGPTEILSRQLYETFRKLVDRLNEEGAGIRLEYLAGAMKASEKKPVLKALKSGEIDIIVGTHSLMSGTVEFANLGFVAIDEQQKFGAEQRSRLMASRADGRIPDVLMQTATPIPRSTAQVFYGDVDMILLDEKPPGRIPIKTIWVEEDPVAITSDKDHVMWADVRNQVAGGNQAFVVTPLVLDSTSVDSASVERTYAALSGTVFPDLKVGYVHGKMKAAEQREYMQRFRAKEFDILVASTVVEVGVDIPDATRVVILSADRMGASSLHQIRGRVGRNSKPSRCYLVSLGKTDDSRERLQALVDHENGFEVAKADLKNRGEGTIFGTGQSGASEMVFASLTRHGRWVPRAQEEAQAILAGPHREKAIQDSKDRFAVTGRLL